MVLCMTKNSSACEFKPDAHLLRRDGVELGIVLKIVQSVF